MNWFTFLIGFCSVYVAACLSYVMVVYDKDMDGEFADFLIMVMIEVAKVMGISAMFIVGIVMMCLSCKLLC